MKTTIGTLLGAGLSLLVTFGSTDNAAAQTAARIAFRAPVTKHHQTSYEILSMNQDGSGIKQLTRSGGAWPSWSSDQSYIAFERSGTIYVMDGAKGEFKGGWSFAVVPASGTGHDWSPDDSAIVYTGTSDIGYGLWLVSVNPATGAVGTPILLKEGVCLEPKISPDGTRIAYWGGGRVSVLDLTTGTETTSSRSSSAPSWSPDGTKIAFGGVVCYDGDPQDCHSEIVIADPDLTGWTPVTALKSFSSFPTWSPNGDELVFFSQISGSKAIYKTTMGSGTMSLLYDGAEEGSDWNP